MVLIMLKIFNTGCGGPLFFIEFIIIFGKVCYVDFVATWLSLIYLGVYDFKRLHCLAENRNSNYHLLKKPY